ncbi:MAG: amidohydrolase family protein [Blastocatellia bacterium]|nr:amidohydrolase family protein [Blastocatellia bacterium]
MVRSGLILLLVLLVWFPHGGPLAAQSTGFVAYPKGSLAITNVQVVDGTGAKARTNQTIVVEQGNIVFVGEKPDKPFPAGTTVIDGTGKTLIPGFVMLHEHMFYPTGQANYTEMLSSFPLLYLAGGTTTLRTAGTMNPYGDLNLKKAIENGTTAGPDIHVTAPYLEGPGLPILKVKALRGVADAERMVEYWAAEGATSYKAYMHIHANELKAVIAKAHQKGHHVTAHLCSVTYRQAATLGIDNLEHGFFVASDFVENKKPDECPARKDVVESFVKLDLNSPQVKALIDFLIARKVTITSTPTVFETFVPGRPQAYPDALGVLLPEIREQYLRTWTQVSKQKDTTQQVYYSKAMELEKMFVRAGGNLVVGTDPTGYGGVVPGFAGKRAIELLVEAGYPFEQAIQFATLNGAKFLGLAKTVGSIEKGKRADFSLIDGDPLKDPPAIRKIPLVFKAGVGYDSSKIFASQQNTVGLH